MSAAEAGRQKRTDESWVHAIDPRMPEVAHGWKLHVSARPAGLDGVVRLVPPALDEYVCHVKYARTPEVLRSLNSGFRSPGAVGQAVTVYPAPVYYRYGPFEATYRTAAGGRLESVMTGPDGQTFAGWPPAGIGARRGRRTRSRPRTAGDEEGDAAAPDDDRHAFGVTLGFAVTGLEPVLIDEDAAVNRDRTLAGLEAAGVPGEASARIRTLMNVSGDSRMPPVPDDDLLAEGIAHGDAGGAYFLAEYARVVADPEAVTAAREACDRIAALIPAIIARALAPEGTRRYGSWCRGLAGIGSVLIRAGRYLGEPRYGELAEQCADVCVRVAPRLPHVVQCCGLAGVGDFLIDVAEQTAAGQR